MPFCVAKTSTALVFIGFFCLYGDPVTYFETKDYNLKSIFGWIRALFVKQKLLPWFHFPLICGLFQAQQLWLCCPVLVQFVVCLSTKGYIAFDHFLGQLFCFGGPKTIFRSNSGLICNLFGTYGYSPGFQCRSDLWTFWD